MPCSSMMSSSAGIAPSRSRTQVSDRHAVRLIVVTGLSAAIGAVVLANGLSGGSVESTVGRRRRAPAIASGEYGRQLVAHTAELLGPDEADQFGRYISRRLDCGACHLAAGTEPGTLAVLQ